jgi:hypothetical protein
MATRVSTRLEELEDIEPAEVSTLILLYPDEES